MSEIYRHRPTAWTVGDLRRAIADLPDDTPLLVDVEDEAGGDTVDTYVLTSAGFGRVDRGDGAGLVPAAEFALTCEYPPGDYDPPKYPRADLAAAIPAGDQPPAA